MDTSVSFSEIPGCRTKSFINVYLVLSCFKRRRQFQLKYAAETKKFEWKEEEGLNYNQYPTLPDIFWVRPDPF